ncbi:hypothetical protein AMAG_10375 [Allomyces macrogynus ATCC 38327]|uniref:Uncharacterized protein n=1 Tax=Allomyces macrogynus (strain ATCC 38327) TaxID=578462 RepID=A0A0L0SU78_ALLM3|nr:hypothetical protein AMAG_10375 [Allomyces macrogynus ATCC 38327]|eukprot:KNE66123.1 hypothetical protein AMAG_10375 [Allomyces macrogynus ATCC 38327]
MSNILADITSMDLVQQALAILPQQNLGRWLAVVGGISIASGLNAIFNPVQYASRLYKPANVNELTGRLFGIWNITSSLVRVYAAYNLTNPTAYRLAMGTFMIALSHFTSEVFFFKSAKLSGALVSALCVASISTAWMWSLFDQFVPKDL